jgi:hypothetical protein
LFQPLALAAGAWLWVMAGRVRSILTVTVCAASVLSALSTLQNSSVWTPSAEKVTAVPTVAAPPSTL